MFGPVWPETLGEAEANSRVQLQIQQLLRYVFDTVAGVVEFWTGSMSVDPLVVDLREDGGMERGMDGGKEINGGVKRGNRWEVWERSDEVIGKTFKTSYPVCFSINKAWVLNRMILFLLHTAVSTQPRNISLKVKEICIAVILIFTKLKLKLYSAAINSIETTGWTWELVAVVHQERSSSPAWSCRRLRCGISSPVWSSSRSDSWWPSTRCRAWPAEASARAHTPPASRMSEYQIN